MRVFIILATIALSHGAKLERTYLPPSHARTSGGSGNFLQTPLSGPGRTQNGFSQNAPGFTQSAPEFSQNAPGFSQNAPGFSQNAPEYSQNAPEFSQNAPELPQNGIETNAYSNEEYNVNNFRSIEARPERAQAALERNAAILRQDNSNDGDAYSYAYETENGIYAEENGVATNGVEAQGGYSYTGDDGQVYSVRYTADQNGFVPQGDHLPTPPPVPQEILKALEQNARDEAAGIYDDGSYKDGKYDNTNGQNNYEQHYNGFNNQQNGFNNQQNGFNNQQNGFNNDDDTVVTNAAFSRSGNYPSGTLTSGITALTFGATNGPVSGASSPTFGAPASSSSRNSVPTFGPTSAFTRGASGSGVEKAYLPPFATQGGNGFGRRQQTFNSRNGYSY